MEGASSSGTKPCCSAEERIWIEGVHSPTQGGGGAVEREGAALAFGEEAQPWLLSVAARTRARSSASPQQQRAGGCACAV